MPSSRRSMRAASAASASAWPIRARAPVKPDMVEPLAKRVADLGWHVQFNVDGEMIRRDGFDTATVCRRRWCSIICAHPPLPAGVEHSSHKIVRELIDKGRTWVKVSGAYSNSKVGPPSYPEGDQDRAGLREGSAGAPGLGQRLAASGPARQQQAGRCAAVRSPGRMGARRGRAAASWCRTRKRSGFGKPA